MGTFKVGDKVKILCYNNFETVIEKIENNLYYSKDSNGVLNYCTAEEMELIEKYSETFNPEAHSSLVIDFDAIETIEEMVEKFLYKEFNIQSKNEFEAITLNLSTVKNLLIQFKQEKS